jgi:hypothetical protein
VSFAAPRWATLVVRDTVNSPLSEFTVVRGTDTIFRGAIHDSVVVRDTGLIPGTRYVWHADRRIGGFSFDTASTVAVTPAITKPGNEYTWEMFRFGAPGSQLRSVWADSNGNVWMCGDIDSVDSRGYPLELIRYHAGQFDFSPVVPNALSASAGTSVGDSVLWLGAPGALWRIAPRDTQSFLFIGGSMPDIGAATLTGIWVAPDESEVFAVGYSGAIVHRFADGHWTGSKNEIGTDYYSFTSLVGFDKNHLYAAGPGYSQGDGVIAGWDGTRWSILARGHYPRIDTTLFGSMRGISGSSPDSLIAVGDSIWRFRGGRWAADLERPFPSLVLGLQEAVDARHWNQVVTSGDFVCIRVWNGERWYIFDQFADFSSDMHLRGVCVVNGEIWVVGSDSQNAVVFHGM